MIARKIKLNKALDRAVLPKATDGNVGYDLVSMWDERIEPWSSTLVGTGLCLADEIEPVYVPHDWIDGQLRYEPELVPFLKIEGRSSLASKGIFPVGGIIDPSYRGEIMVTLYNGTKDVYEVKNGDRIAQLVCYYTLSPIEGRLEVKIEECAQSTKTKRGSKGFGSTGR